MIFHKFSIHFHDFGNAIEGHPQRAHALLLRGVLEQLVEGARRTPRDDPALQPGPHLQDTCTDKFARTKNLNTAVTYLLS